MHQREMGKFEITKTDIEGVVIVTPRVFGDSRGYFMETFSDREFRESVADVDFVQDNESCSSRGVVRGLHFQKPPHAQAKLVRCTAGEVLDIAVDLRGGSPTYGKHVAVRLSADNKRQLFIPAGFAHGFAVLSDTAVFQYKCSDYYHPETEGGIDIYSPSLGIECGIEPADVILSDRDRHHPDFEEFKTPF